MKLETRIGLGALIFVSHAAGESGLPGRLHRRRLGHDVHRQEPRALRGSAPPVHARSRSGRAGDDRRALRQRARAAERQRQGRSAVFTVRLCGPRTKKRTPTSSFPRTCARARPPQVGSVVSVRREGGSNGLGANAIVRLPGRLRRRAHHRQPRRRAAEQLQRQGRVRGPRNRHHADEQFAARRVLGSGRA